MISVADMRKAEHEAAFMGISEALMMENAGANAAKIAGSMFGLKGRKILVFCGTGNNAGDGLVFARHALISGGIVYVYFVKGHESLKPLALENYVILEKLREAGQEIHFLDKLGSGFRADILVDAMLGIGISGEVGEEYSKAIMLFNGMEGKKISLDIPSGIDADTGEVLGCAVRPDVTITFYDKKSGLNAKNSGKIVIADIGFPRIK